MRERLKRRSRCPQNNGTLPANYNLTEPNIEKNSEKIFRKREKEYKLYF